MRMPRWPAVGCVRRYAPEGELAGGGNALSKEMAKVVATGELTEPDALDKVGDTMLRDSWQRIMQKLRSHHPERSHDCCCRRRRNYVLQLQLQQQPQVQA